MLDHLPVKKKPTLNIIPPQLRLKIIIIIIEVIKINKTHFAVRVSTPLNYCLITMEKTI
jgi:hypothetical protein